MVFNWQMGWSGESKTASLTCPAPGLICQGSQPEAEQDVNHFASFPRLCPPGPVPAPSPSPHSSRLIHRDPTPTGTAHELPSPQALATEPPSSPHSHCRRLEARRRVRAFIFLAVSLGVAVSWVHPLTEGPRSSPLAVFVQHRTLCFWV